MGSEYKQDDKGKKENRSRSRTKAYNVGTKKEIQDEVSPKSYPYKNKLRWIMREKRIEKRKKKLGLWLEDLSSTLSGDLRLMIITELRPMVTIKYKNKK